MGLSTNPQQCPTDDELNELLAGTISQHREREFEEHLASCDTCIQRLGGHSSGAHHVDDLLEDYRRGERSLSLPSEDTVSHLSQDTDHDGGSAPVETHIRQVPGYEILGEIARGGMGVVYRARDTALNRDVAIKMISDGLLAGPEKLSRFADEAQTIAKLDHPNIVRIYEVGQHQGHPYFTMEMVSGLSLRDSFDGTPWQPRRAARLVVLLAKAAQAAHECGVVHRDLKPANIILQSTEDQSDWPRIVDFGLAKNLGADMLTLTGEALGTPSYMAPEQASADNENINATTDVYSLGSILYELLTGRAPFRAASVAETLHQVIHDPPARPRTLNPEIPVDLETICLKCLSKQPHERYASASELSSDLERFETGHPIVARPTPLWRRVQKWARRHPAIATLSVAAAVLLLSLVGIWARFTSQLQEQRAIAVRESQNSKISAEKASLSATRAENAADIQTEVMSFLNDMTTELSTLGSNDKLYEALKAAEQKVEQRLEHRPLPMAAYLTAMGDTLAKIDKGEEGLKVLERAERVFVEHDGPDSKNTTRVKVRKLDVLTKTRQIDEARRVVEQLDQPNVEFFERDRWDFQLIRAKLNINDRRFNIAEQGLQQMIDSLSRLASPDQLQLMQAHHILGIALSHQGEFAEAGPHYKLRLDFARDNFPEGHEEILAAENTYGVYLSQIGKPLEAIELLRPAIANARKMLGEEHRTTIEMTQNMAAALSRSKQYDEAQQLFGEAIEKDLRLFGQASTMTIGAMINLAGDFLDQEKFNEGFTYFEKQCDVPAVAEMNNNFAGRLILRYAKICIGAKEYKRAEELLDQLDAFNRKSKSPDSFLVDQVKAQRKRLK
ncbi:MAG: serine/threonine-protein kinase [Planctomycetota bacterium]